MSYLMESLDFGQICRDIEANSAISVKALSERLQVKLLEEVSALDLLDNVIRHAWIGEDRLPEDSSFRALAKELELKLHPFTEISFNQLTVTEYRSSKGTSIHTDRQPNLAYSGFICIFKIGGKGDFYVYDSNRSIAQQLDSSPGSLIVFKSDVPHAFTNIEPPAYSFVLRQVIPRL